MNRRRRRSEAGTDRLLQDSAVEQILAARDVVVREPAANRWALDA